MGPVASQITSLTIVYSSVYSSAQIRALRYLPLRGGGGGGVHRCPVNSPHKRPVTRKMFPVDDVIIVPADVIDRLYIRHQNKTSKWTMRHVTLLRRYMNAAVSQNTEHSVYCSKACVWHASPGGCFTKVSRALQDILSTFVYYRNHTFDENFRLKLCT